MILLRPIEPPVTGATPNAAGARHTNAGCLGSWCRPGYFVAGMQAASRGECGTADLNSSAPPAGAGGAPPAPVDIAHKAVVLRCLQAQCEDGQLLVDLFVNYDCDLEVRPRGQRLCSLGREL